MKNNFLLYFALLFIFFLNHNSFSDEFKFEFTEIQIEENGNFYKGINGGKVISDDDVEIIADFFEYKKKDLILRVFGNVSIIDHKKNIIINGNEFFYEKKIDKIYSIGKTFVNFDNNYEADTYNLVFLRKENELYSNQRTKINDNKKNYYDLDSFNYNLNNSFLTSPKAKLEDKNRDKYDITDLLLDTKNKKLIGKDISLYLHKDIFKEERNDPRIKGNSVISDSKKTLVSKGVFTSCQVREGKCPPWHIKSEKIIHDKVKKDIIYKNAWVNIYDIPIVYFPKFFHPDPTVKRRSGFLKPSTSSSEKLNRSVYVPYFYVISESKDMTFKPRIFSDHKYTIQSEYREARKYSESVADFSITKGYKNLVDNTKDTRTHFFSKTEIDLNLADFKGEDDESKLDIQIQRTSNDTYFKVFELESPLIAPGGMSTLLTSLELNLKKDDKSLMASAKMYETLSGKTSDRYQYVFPNYNYSEKIDLDKDINGELNFISSGYHNLYDTNVADTVIINDINYESNVKYFNNGLTNKINLLFKNVNTAGENSNKYSDKTQSEIMSSLVLNYEYPLMKYDNEGYESLVPRLSFMFSPNDMKNKRTEQRRMDVESIFSPNRLGFSDTLESGESITLGLNYKKYLNEKSDGEGNDISSEAIFETGFARVFRAEENLNIPTYSTIGTKGSDIVGNAIFRPGEHLSFEYNYSLDSDFSTINYNYLETKLDLNNFVTEFKFLDQSNLPNDEGFLQNDTTVKFNESNSLTFSTRRNRKIDLTEYYNWLYEYKNDCLIAGIEYKKRYYSNNDLKPSEDLFFSITLFPLTTYTTTNLFKDKN